MRRVSTSWLPVGILTVLAATSFWLKQVVDSAGGGDPGRAQHHPDLVVSGFAVHQLGSDGHTRYTLSADTMSHYPDDDSSDFAGVRLVAFEPGQPALQVSADQAQRRVNEERVRFSGRVEVVRQPSPQDTVPLVMHTSELEVWPDRKLTVAREPVHVQHGADSLQADTMVFDNKLSIAEFTRAKAIFQSPAR